MTQNYGQMRQNTMGNCLNGKVSTPPKRSGQCLLGTVIERSMTFFKTKHKQKETYVHVF